jgi:plasmid stabilization system protein ParE
LGQLRPDLGIAIRVLVEHPYIVPYRYQTENLVEIVRVLHGARDITDALDGF